MVVGGEHAASIQDIIENLNKVATDLHPEGKKKIETVKAIDQLRKCVEDLVNIVQKDRDDKPDKPDNNNTVRELEDEIDHLKQKSLKGKIIITSKIPQGDGCIKTDAQIKQEGGTLANHVKNLAKFKYNIDITEDDIASCFHLPKGGILVTFWQKWSGSPYQKLVAAIKSPMNSHIPLYFNFMLTKRRSKLLFNIRKLKQNDKIYKFYSDEDGCISIKAKPGDRNTKVTDVVTEASAKLKTWTDEELAHAFP